MPGETDLRVMLRDLRPRLHGGRYRFVTGREAERVDAVLRFVEAEGPTEVIRDDTGDADDAFAWITLEVRSSLAAVGLTAAVSAQLTAAGIACNVVAAYHHDHLFVPYAARHEALAALGRVAGTSGADVAGLLGLESLPEEGGLFRQTHRDDHGTAIYYLLVAPEFSALHRLPGAEVFHHYAGPPARMLLLQPGGGIREPVLGDDLARGERPQVVVPGGTWQGCETLGAWSLLGATMAPGYRDADFELSPAAPLVADWPQAAERIEALTRT